MLNNCEYNKIKLLHEMSCITWFLDKHAIPDSKNSNDTDCAKLFENIKNNLQKHITSLEKEVKK